MKIMVVDTQKNIFSFFIVVMGCVVYLFLVIQTYIHRCLGAECNYDRLRVNMRHTQHHDVFLMSHAKFEVEAVKWEPSLILPEGLPPRNMPVHPFIEKKKLRRSKNEKSPCSDNKRARLRGPFFV